MKMLYALVLFLAFTVLLGPIGALAALAITVVLVKIIEMSVEELRLHILRRKRAKLRRAKAIKAAPLDALLSPDLYDSRGQLVLR